MKLDKEQVSRYKTEIAGLYKEHLSEEPANALIYFAILGENDELQAIAAVRNYMGHWYLRGHVVKPEFRGRGMQRQLIQESLEFLRTKTHEARVSVFPWNTHSIRNIEATGFEFEKLKKLDNGELVKVYKIKLSP